jgi:recombination protein RecA
MERTKRAEPLSSQMQRKVHNNSIKKEKEPEGSFSLGAISTGSTLLDLCISAGRIRGGGLPYGILVEAFGPNSSGKTILLCQIAGNVEAADGNALFNDPEARLSEQFSMMFGMHLKKKDYKVPDTVTEVFETVRSWKPENPDVINGIFIDSLAALSTDMEMSAKGDKMGSRRAKELSQELRVTCRIIKKKKLLMVCSNQIRDNMDAGMFESKTTTPGGHAMEFYSSVRLKFSTPKKVWDTVTVAGKEVKRAIGIESEIEVFKNSVWKPYRKAPVIMIFDYGIDDIRANLQFLKEYTGAKTYKVGDIDLGKSLKGAIRRVEDNNLVRKLKNKVIDLWMDIESKFDSERKPRYDRKTN